MIANISPVWQALLGTLFTWFLTALGAAVVFFIPSKLSEIKQRKLLDLSLGFAAGVMLAASYWSLLDPAIQFANESGYYGDNGEYSFIPVSIGLILGAAFVYLTDKLLPNHDTIDILTSNNTHSHSGKKKDKLEDDYPQSSPNNKKTKLIGNNPNINSNNPTGSSALMTQRRKLSNGDMYDIESHTFNSGNYTSPAEIEREKQRSYRRIIMLVIAIVIHNFPEGLAVGVGFGALNNSSKEQYNQHFNNARTLAIGIGLQNFPEGLAVSLPLMRVGYDYKAAFMYGQLSGMVEPLGGLLGAYLIYYILPLLPYALSFAAGAMIYVVIDDLIPETRSPGSQIQFANAGFIIGFVVMMSMDVALG